MIAKIYVKSGLNLSEYKPHKKLKHIIYKIVDRGGDIMNGKFSCFNSSNIITARIKEFDGNGKG